MTHRAPWSAIPHEVVRAVETELGAPIVVTREAAEGFSPAVAVTAELGNGQRVFLKAVTASINAETVMMQRHEAMVVRQLPSSVPTPPLRFELEVDDWHVLAFAHVDAQPVTDPRVHLRGIDELYAALAHVEVDGLAHVADHHASLFDSWTRMAVAAPAFEGMVALEQQADFVRSEQRLMHCDARDDNALVDSSGQVVFVDWANACLGTPAIDAVGAIPALAVRFGVGVPELAGESRLIAECEPEALVGLVAALAGYFARASTLPSPPGMPTVRAFQRAQAEPMLTWLADLVGDRSAVPTMTEIERALSPDRSL